MDEYNWDDWDSQASDYVGGDASSYEPEDNTSWNQVNSTSPDVPQNYFGGGQGYQDQYQTPDNMYNFGNSGGDTGQDFYKMSGFQQDNPYGLQEQNFNQQQTPEQTSPGFDWAKLGSSALNAFGNSAQGAAQSASIPALMKLFAGLGAARGEKQSNQQLAQQMPQQVQQFRQQTSPFDNPAQVDPNSMRGLAQAGYRQSMADPYSSPIVANQVAAINAQQARSDAKAGRRSNLAASTPAALAEQAKVAAAYQKQLGDQSGAGQYMGMGGLEQLMSGLKYGAQGNSPYYSALGQLIQGNTYSGNPNLAQATNAQQQQYRG